MKRIFTLVALFSFVLTNAQTFVSTTPENKNVILEEFTGISCGYCPDGHLIASGIHDNNPDDFAVIAIHAGGFASPQGPGTDFRTTAGTAIDSYWGISGYPAGTVNRPASGDVGRSAWNGATNTLLAQSSPVNVGIEASVDMGTSTLTVDVEVYYTGTQTVTSNMLNIAVVQNNVEGPQSSGSTNPSQMLPNGNYNHQHMLRHMMTGTWGEQITNISQGTLFSNQYTWTMPADINGVALDPTNIGIIAFVSEDNEEILSGTIEVAPNLIFANAYDAYIVSATANNNICSSIAKGIEVEIKNYGNLPLTTLDITYDINGGMPITFPWAGFLTSGQATTVTLSNMSYTAAASNTVNVSVSNPNGNTDQNTSNDNTSTTFLNKSMQGVVTLGIASGNATIDITTDQYPSESSWEIVDDNGIVVASGPTIAQGPYASQGAQAQATAILSPGTCYAFYMYDSYGDGIIAPGGYDVKDASGTVIATASGMTGSLADHYFETTGTNPCAGLTLSAPTTTFATCTQSNGTATIYATGGMSPYSYVWSNGQSTITATALFGGAYSCTITDANGCTATDVVGVGIDNSMAPVSATVTTDVSCNGMQDGTIDMTITAGAMPYTYLWSDGSINEDLAGIGAGTYLIEYTDANGCVGYASATITEPTAVTAQFTIVDESGAGTNDGSASAASSGGAGGYTYLWSDGQTTANATGLSAGTYACDITDANGCIYLFSVTIGGGVTAVEDVQKILLVYPNPVKDVLTIDGMYSSVEIYDIYGKLVLSSDAKRTINVSSLSNGVYFININTNNIITVKKITIAK